MNAASGGMDFQTTGNRAVGFLSNPEARAEIRIQEEWHNGENYVGIKAPEVINDNITFTLPDSYGLKDQVLSTDGNGQLLWKQKEILSNSSNGNYVPDFTGVKNIEQVKAIAPFHYMRVGQTVTVSGEITIFQDDIEDSHKFLLSIPIPSNLSNKGDCMGFGVSLNSQFRIRGDEINNCAFIAFEKRNSSVDTFSIHFTYKIK